MASRMGEDRTRSVVDVACYDEIFLHSFQDRANQVMFSIFPFWGPLLLLSLVLETMALVWALTFL